jgi:hypothetical protein
MTIKTNKRGFAPRPGLASVPNSSAEQWHIAGFLALVTIIAFARVSQCGFVSYDDSAYVQNNPHLQLGLSWEGIKWAFTGKILGLWHPLTLLSLQADYQFFGYNPVAYHVHNLIYHTANVVLLFFFLHAATADRWRSAAAAALFAVHPLRTESVAWIVEQKDTLSTLLILLAMLGYVHFVRSRSWITLAWVLLAFAGSMLTKPMYVTLPVLLLIIDVWPLGRPAKSGKISGDDVPRFAPKTAGFLLREKIPFFAVILLISGTFVFAFISAVFNHTTIVPTTTAIQSAAIPGIPDPTSAVVCLKNSLVSYVRYVGKIFWFKNLAVVYPEVNWNLSEVAGSTLFLVAVCVFSWRQRRRRPWIFAGWLWFLLVLLPVNNIIKAGPFSMADRYTYLASVGIMIALVWSVPDTFMASASSRRLWGGAFAAVVLVLSLSTFVQIGYWKDSLSLNRHAIEVTDNNYLCHVNLGVALHEAGDDSGAAAQYEIAMEIRPFEPVAHSNLGNVLENAHRYAEAIDEYTKAAYCNPSDTSNAVRLIIPYASLGQTDKALFCIQHAQQLGVNTPELHNAIGFTDNVLHRTADAREEYQAALALNPNYAPARTNLSKLESSSAIPSKQ